MENKKNSINGVSSKVRVVVLGSLFSLSVLAHASVVQVGNAGLSPVSQPLSAQVLRSLRGRYVAGNNVVYFGLEMISRWSTASGDTIAVGTNVGLSVGKKPSLTVNSFDANTGHAISSPENTSGRTISGNPTQGVSGIGQGIQVVGDNNVVSNRALVNVTGNTGAQGPTGSGATNLVDTNGAAVGSVTLRDNSIVVAINLPGQGLVQQTLGAQGLAQSAQVLSGANNVLNQLTLSVGFAQTAGFSPAQINTILGSMKGL